MKSLSRQWRSDILEYECHAQIDAFSAQMGFLPDFLDGHQHIHLFPVIRDVIFKVYQDRLRSNHTYMRLSEDHTPSFDLATKYKKTIIKFLNGRHIKNQLLDKKVIYNQSFAGIYPFQRAVHYRRFFLKFLGSIKTNGIIMCHPGYQQESSSKDEIADARYHEFQYFSSDHFQEDCEDTGVSLARFDRMLLKSHNVLL